MLALQRCTVNRLDLQCPQLAAMYGPLIRAGYFRWQADTGGLANLAAISHSFVSSDTAYVPLGSLWRGRLIHPFTLSHKASAGDVESLIAQESADTLRELHITDAHLRYLHLGMMSRLVKCMLNTPRVESCVLPTQGATAVLERLRELQCPLITFIISDVSPGGLDLSGPFARHLRILHLPTDYGSFGSTFSPSKGVQSQKDLVIDCDMLEAIIGQTSASSVVMRAPALTTFNCVPERSTRFQFIDCKRLAHLSFVRGAMEDELFAAAVAALPALERLEVDGVAGLTTIQFASDTLLYLYVSRCLDVRRVSVQTPQLLSFVCGELSSVSMEGILRTLQGAVHGVVATSFYRVSFEHDLSAESLSQLQPPIFEPPPTRLLRRCGPFLRPVSSNYSFGRTNSNVVPSAAYLDELLQGCSQPRRTGQYGRNLLQLASAAKSNAVDIVPSVSIVDCTIRHEELQSIVSLTRPALLGVCGCVELTALELHDEESLKRLWALTVVDMSGVQRIVRCAFGLFLIFPNMCISSCV